MFMRVSSALGFESAWYASKSSLAYAEILGVNVVESVVCLFRE